MTTSAYLVHGFGLESDVLVDAPSRPPGRCVDLKVQRGSSEAPETAAAPDLLAERDQPWRSTFVRHPEGYTLRLSEVCTFCLDPELRTAKFFKSKDVPDELVSLFVTGALMAAVISLSGGVVLHASALEVGGSVVAIAGQSGAGKSTLAGLACAAGLPLFADDALRVERCAAIWRAYRGATALRLRQSASSLSCVLPGAGRPAPDGRLTWTPALQSHSESPPLREILLPRHTRDRGRVRRQPLARSAALVELLRALRFGSWRDPWVLESQTRSIAALVREVPVSLLLVPRLDEFDGRAATELGDALRGAP